MKVNVNGRNFLIFGRLFMSRSQNFDVLSAIQTSAAAIFLGSL